MKSRGLDNISPRDTIINMRDINNRITPYKGRKLDYTKPVMVYRNLNCKGISYSIRQGNLVVAHTDALTLRDVKFVVSKAGQQRVIREKRKNVHAFVKGFVAPIGVMGTSAVYAEDKERQLPARIKYNPYLGIGFYCDNLTQQPFEVHTAMGVIINKKGVSAAYTN